MLQTGEQNSEIYIVDDDAMVRESLSVVFSQAGYRVRAFCEGTSVVAAARVRIPACIIIDIFLPGTSGLDILKQLDAANYPAPIFIVSARRDISIAVEAIKNGACDFIEKQTDVASIVTRVGKTIATWASRQQTDATSEIRWRHFPGRPLLSRREIEVLAQIMAGASNKEAAKTLGISSRTIETHRQHIMKKLGAKNAVELVHIVLGTKGRRSQDASPRAENDQIVRV
jgi:FixJ family two-component response regulator